MTQETSKCFHPKRSQKNGGFSGCAARWCPEGWSKNENRRKKNVGKQLAQETGIDGDYHSNFNFESWIFRISGVLLWTISGFGKHSWLQVASTFPYLWGTRKIFLQLIPQGGLSSTGGFLDSSKLELPGVLLGIHRSIFPYFPKHQEVASYPSYPELFWHPQAEVNWGYGHQLGCTLVQIGSRTRPG